MYEDIIADIVKEYEGNNEVIFLRALQEKLNLPDAELIDLIDETISSELIEIVSIKKGGNNE